MISKSLRIKKQSRVLIITIANDVANESQRIRALVEDNKTSPNQNGKTSPLMKSQAMKKSKSRFGRP